MPSYVPRNEPIRKKEQLLNSSEDLRLAILHNKPATRIKKLADRYKDANILFIKAKIHVQKELEYQNKKQRFNIKKLEEEKLSWEQKSLENIVEEFNKL